MTVPADAVRLCEVQNRISVIGVGQMTGRVFFTKKSQQEVEHGLSP